MIPIIISTTLAILVRRLWRQSSRKLKKLLVDDLKKLKDIQFSIAKRLRHLQDLNKRIEDATATKGIPTIRVPQSMPEAVRDECQARLDDINKRIILETNAIFTELRKKELSQLKSEKVKLKLEYKNKFTECIKYFCKGFNNDELSTNILVYNAQKEQTAFFNSALSTLSLYYGEDTSCFKICEQAILRRGYGSKSANVHERLNLGDIVQILVNDGYERASILDTTGSENGRPAYFVIGAFIQSQSDHSWIAVKQCKLLSRGKMRQVPDFNAKPVLPVLTTNMFDRHHQHQLQFIKLSKSVRKVGFQHDCSVGNRCVWSSSSRRITHAA